MRRTGLLLSGLLGLVFVMTGGGCQCDNEPNLGLEEPDIGWQDPKPCLKTDPADTTPCTTGVIDFGRVPLNTTVQVTIPIANSGTAALEFKDFVITYTGGATKDAFTEGSRPGVIDPNKQAAYSLAYLPKAAGKDQGTLRIEAYINKIGDKIEYYDFTLVGEGVQSAIDVCVLDDAGAESACQSGCAKDPATGRSTDCLAVAFGEVNLAVQKDAVLKKVKVKNGGGLSVMVHSTPVLQCPVATPDCALAVMTGAREYLVNDPKTGAPEAAGLNEIELLPGTEQIVTVGYKPYDGGADKGVFRVTSEDLVSPEINVMLGGAGKAPKVCPEPVTVDFKTVNVGQGKQETVKLKSCGTDPLTIDSVTLVNGPSNWYTLDGLAPNAPVTLNPGEEVVVTVTCKPDKVSSETGQLDVRTNDPSLKDGTGYIRMLCQGREPPACKIKADPSTIDYGKLAGGKKVTKDFYVLNVGDEACNVTALNGPSDAAHYRIAGIQDEAGAAIAGAPFGIDPTRRVKVTVEFTSPIEKNCPGDMITVVNSSVNAPSLDVTLRGCGGELSICKLKTMPVGTLNFGNVAKGARKTMGVNFENIGTDDCQITSSAFGAMTGDWYSFAKNYSFPINVPAQTTGKVEIACSPKGTGPAVTKFGIPDLLGQNVVNTSTSDPAQPPAGTMCTNPGWCHKLLCTGVISKLDVLPNPIEFGLVTMGCNSQELVVKLYNNGTGALNVSRLEVIPNPAVFLISSAPVTPFAIGANTSVQLKMKYHPSKKGIETGVLRITTDAPNAINGQIDISLTGEGTDITDVKDVFKQTDKPTVDALFCVDNSGSMSEEQTGLSSNFPTFLNYATSLNIDYQMGVVTSEINEAEKGDTGDMIYPGVLFQRQGYARIAANFPPNPATPPYQPAGNPLAAITANTMPGTCCSGEQESCMESVRLALTDPNINDDQANKGFLRKYAKLVVIMMSDEEDQSPGTVDYYVDFLKQLKGARNNALLSVSMIAGFDRNGTIASPPSAATCGGGATSGGADAGQRYIDMFKKAGNGLAFSICNADWGANMQKLGLDAFVAIIEYYLSRQADPSTLIVKVNGTAVTNDPVNGYTFDPNSNSIVFGSGAVPAKGATIEVTYKAQCY